MTCKNYRNTYAKVNLNAIKYNLEAIQVRLGKRKQIIPILKGNAYGHGAVEVAKYLENEQFDYFAVSLLEEAIELREAGIQATILVLEWVAPHYAYIAIEYNLILTAFQSKWLKDVENVDLQKKLKIHIKIDTGMGRNGLRNEIELIEFIDELIEMNTFEVAGVYTHFATADYEDDTYYQRQINKFNYLLNILENTYPENSLAIHIGNSGASIQYPKDMYDYSRVGVSIYGMYPSPIVKKLTDVDLKPALELKSEIIHVKQVNHGDKISYGNTYTASSEEWIGTIAIGYADGWLRKLQGSDVLVEGKRMPIIGRICMDMFMIKLDQAYEVGTEVTLIGRSGKEFISVDEIAEKSDTINYEIITTLTNRIPRIYIN